MRGHDEVRVQERLYVDVRSTDELRNAEALPPVLLSLPRERPKPSTLRDPFPKASADRVRLRPEPSPILDRTGGMHRTTLRAMPALHPDRLVYFVEVSLHVPVAPQSQPIASRAS